MYRSIKAFIENKDQLPMAHFGKKGDSNLPCRSAAFRLEEAEREFLKRKDEIAFGKMDAARQWWKDDCQTTDEDVRQRQLLVGAGRKSMRRRRSSKRKITKRRSRKRSSKRKRTRH